MHHIYNTEGLILSSKNFKEADKYFYILTSHFGLIYAEAVGIRKISSKLRFVLSDFSYIKLDLVKRKNIWRITSALKSNILEEIKKDKEKLKIFVNISNLLIRLLPEEEQNKILFNNISKGLLYLDENDKKANFQNIEILIILKILNDLGYLNKERFDNYINLEFNDISCDKIFRNKDILLKEINKTLKETHL